MSETLKEYVEDIRTITKSSRAYLDEGTFEGYPEEVERCETLLDYIDELKARQSPSSPECRKDCKVYKDWCKLEADNAGLVTDKAKLVEQVDQFWDGLWNRWEIESREDIEKDTKESWAEGTSPLNVALHYIWKREPKVAKLVEALEWIAKKKCTQKEDCPSCYAAEALAAHK